jgi:DNA-binding NarL/FixJ family response regulator
MQDQPAPDTHDRLALLSARETTVLEMLSLGLTNGQMAERLSVTIHAIKSHLSSIYAKLGVSNRTEAAVYYLRDGRSTVKAGDAG